MACVSHGGICKVILKSAQNKHPGPRQHMRRYELMRSATIFQKDQEEVKLINQLHCTTYYISPTGVDQLISEKHTTQLFYKHSHGQHICTSMMQGVVRRREQNFSPLSGPRPGATIHGTSTQPTLKPEVQESVCEKS